MSQPIPPSHSRCVNVARMNVPTRPGRSVWASGTWPALTCLSVLDMAKTNAAARLSTTISHACPM